MSSIVQRVLAHAATGPDRTCVGTFSPRDGDATRTWRQVVDGAGRAAAGLRARGIDAGDVVVLIGTHHLDLYATWLGAVWIGAIPTVLAEPSVRVDRAVYWSRLRALLERIDGRLLAHDPRIVLPPEETAGLAHVAYDALAAHDGVPPSPRAPVEDELLLLQHSSGTTGLHKGVMLSHGAVLRHAEAYAAHIAMSRDDVVASWLPLYHDMGMIACFVGPLLAGAEVVWLSPFEWVANPGMLLEAIDRRRATLTWLPNFAFMFLAKRTRFTTPPSLASLRAVVDCSEPVTGEALDAFGDAFASFGVSRDALHACYAMAENVFAVTSTNAAHPPRRRLVDRGAWQATHRAIEVSAGTPSALVHVSSGVAVPGCDVKIVDAAGAACPSTQAGRVLIRSSFLLSGYFRRPELNEGLLDADGFYDTGDVGYLDEAGHLYVTGREKDLVIVAGKNVYPQDVEQAACEVEGVHPGRAVCFGVRVGGAETDGLVLLVESDLGEPAWPALVTALRRAIPTKLDLDLSDVKVVARGKLRKSSSGKLARGGNRDWYLAGDFGPIPPILKGAS